MSLLIGWSVAPLRRRCRLHSCVAGGSLAALCLPASAGGMALWVWRRFWLAVWSGVAARLRWMRTWRPLGWWRTWRLIVGHLLWWVVGNLLVPSVVVGDLLVLPAVLPDAGRTPKGIAPLGLVLGRLPVWCRPVGGLGAGCGCGDHSSSRPRSRAHCVSWCCSKAVVPVRR